MPTLFAIFDVSCHVTALVGVGYGLIDMRVKSSVTKYLRLRFRSLFRIGVEQKFTPDKKKCRCGQFLNFLFIFFLFKKRKKFSSLWIAGYLHRLDFLSSQFLFFFFFIQLFSLMLPGWADPALLQCRTPQKSQCVWAYMAQWLTLNSDLVSNQTCHMGHSYHYGISIEWVWNVIVTNPTWCENSVDILYMVENPDPADITLVGVFCLNLISRLALIGRPG